MADVLFSVIIPSIGTRPKSLELAISSVLSSIEYSCNSLAPESVEVLVGFDGIKGKRVVKSAIVHYYDLPRDKNWGNGIRNILLNLSRGERVVFLDDDNALTPSAFDTYLDNYDSDMLIARIDVRRAFECEYLPREIPGKSLIRQGNIDPLCLCLSRELVVVRCGGWAGKGKYESDYLNILYYSRRARNIRHVKDVVGIYDAGQGLDPEGINLRQKQLFEYGKKSQVLS
ncbi:MAG: glycosyltransferase family 2 protein [Desulfonatronovibrio sp. MSAO_Bac4]|nr:MAG: glycosyltransferase family 2 protein [Desulfonatronovibrio sp. MSAO_Bac4]